MAVLRVWKSSKHSTASQICAPSGSHGGLRASLPAAQRSRLREGMGAAQVTRGALCRAGALSQVCWSSCSET